METANAIRDPMDDYGKLILRVLLAILILFHGVSKLIGGVGFITGMLAKIGLPASFGYLVYIGEVVAPLLMLAGLFTRAAALVIAGNMIVALLLVHTSQFFTLNETGGWALELQAMYLGGAIAVALLGAGRYSIGGARGRFN
jgi:putative oxidoreductase